MNGADDHYGDAGNDHLWPTYGETAKTTRNLVDGGTGDDWLDSRKNPLTPAGDDGTMGEGTDHWFVDAGPDDVTGCEVF